MNEADFIVVGGGVAGASVARALAPRAKVIILEMESHPGYHTSGRSAALYSKRYKEPSIRGLAAASGNFLENPPPGFSQTPLLSPRGLLIFGREDQRAAVDGQFTSEQIQDGVAEAISIKDACSLVPCLNPDYVSSAMYVPAAADIDVHALHQGFLSLAQRSGAKLVCDAPVTALSFAKGKWEVGTPRGTFFAPIIINAAGAWADEIATLAGLTPLGIQPLRRTCITFDPPSGVTPGSWPMAMDAEENFYFKPEAGRILASPCDEHGSLPVDAQPEELDIAHAVDRVERATTLKVQHINHRWAGLRCFMADRRPSVGKDNRAEGFIWLAGLGGFGMMTSEALGRLAASAAMVEAPPKDILTSGVDPSRIAPSRLVA
ncbi:MAG: FAD-binding oxidoreductase [Rhodospirillales bacterium]